jgi:hypothetical protein
MQLVLGRVSGVIKIKKIAVTYGPDDGGSKLSET